MKAYLNTHKDDTNKKRVEIMEEEGGIYLYQYNEENVCISDTWHLSIEEAKAQAQYEFGIKEEDWLP